MALSVGHNLVAGQNEVGTTAELLVATNPTRKSVTILNADTTATDYLWIGEDDTVSASNGFRIAGGESLKIDDYNGPVYAIATTAATNVCTLEVS